MCACSSGYHVDTTLSSSTDGSEFRVNTYTSDAQQSASVAVLDSGKFVITWQSDNQDGNSRGVYAQRYNADGTKDGSEFQVNEYTLNSQQSPSVAALDSGKFVVTWQSYQDGDGYGIYAQRYNADGTTDGSEFRVNTYTTSTQQSPLP